jgi:hypothetical protein
MQRGKLCFAHGRPSLVSVRGMLGWLSELAPTQGVPARRSRLLPTCRLRNLMVGGGVEADGRGRWAVERVIAVRGAGAKREAQVMWKGIDRRTGLPWDDERVPFVNLTRDLCAPWLATRVRSRPKRPIPAQQSDGSARRISPRMAGEEPVEGMA